MKNIARALRALMLLPFTSIALVGCSSESTPDRHVVLLFTSDEHSHVLSFSPELDDYPAAKVPGSGALVGGAARRATVLGEQRNAAAAAGFDALTVSAGDNHMGALPHIAFESMSLDYEVMAALGYDVTTIGNHELDFGPSAFASSISAAKANRGLPPIVASNIHFSDESAGDDDLAEHYSDDPTDGAPIHAYRIVTTASGIKVGFLGWMGVDAEKVARAKAPVRFSALGLDAEQEGNPKAVLPKLYADLQTVVDALRSHEKVDLVVGLSHGGIPPSSTGGAEKESEDYAVAANVKGIDVIISGHAHNDDPEPIVVPSAKGGRDTLVLNAGLEGRQVGRVELVLPGDGSSPTWNRSTQTLLAVDDTTVPDPSFAPIIDDVIARVEKEASYLPNLLSRVEGGPVKDDPTKVGDLYFRPIGATDFDVADVHSMVFLSADAMLAAADAWGHDQGPKRGDAPIAIESAGVVRGALMKGKTGVISAADAFAVVPLGSSPVDGTIGYPLVVAYLAPLEIRAVFELALALRQTNSDYDIGPAGLRVEYDATRPPIESVLDLFDDTKGQVMRILFDGDHSDGFEQFSEVLYDRANHLEATRNFPVATSSYIAQFASEAGAELKDASGRPITVEEAILRRADQSEIKQIEAFLGYIAAFPGGKLPPRYDVTSKQATKRLVCINGC